MRATPRYIAVTVHNTTPQSLYDLLHAIDSDTEDHCQQIEFQEDIAAGVSKTYVGNSDLNIGTGVYGIILVAGVPTIFPSLSSNLVLLRQIFLATDGADIKIGVSITTR